MLKRILNILLMIWWAGSVCAAVAPKPFTVVLDPGHGGKDAGCVGNITNEKTIVLDVASRLGAMIAEQHPEVAVKYTRDTDKYLTLQERANVANNAHGDLFISIHVNSVDRKARNRASVHGASVYTLGLHKSDSNLGVAMRENAVIELEQDYSEKYQGFDPNSSESYINIELNQNTHVAKSLDLAAAMQNELITTAGRADKNVRQAGFWVLWAVAMPSVLVELDFICNPEAEKFLSSEAGREKCARALANAFTSYYDRRHKGGPAKVEKSHAKDVNAETSTMTDTAKVKESVPNDEPTYHIQFLTSARPLKHNDSRLAKIADADYYRDGGLCKYFSGTFTTQAQAQKALQAIRKHYPEAFIIKLLNGKRI